MRCTSVSAGDGFTLQTSCLPSEWMLGLSLKQEEVPPSLILLDVGLKSCLGLDIIPTFVSFLSESSLFSY